MLLDSRLQYLEDTFTIRLTPILPPAKRNDNGDAGFRNRRRHQFNLMLRELTDLRLQDGFNLRHGD